MFKLFNLRAFDLGAACLLAAGVSAHANYAMIHNQEIVPGSGTHFEWYVDFASTTVATHQSTTDGTFGGENLKYYAVGLGNYGSSDTAPTCYEVRTHQVTTPDMDTRIWFDPQSGNRVSLNDDANGSWFSAVRVWLDGRDANLRLYVASFSAAPANNEGDFRISVDRIPLSEAACTTGQTTLAWVKHKDHTPEGGEITETWQSR